MKMENTYLESIKDIGIDIIDNAADQLLDDCILQIIPEIKMGITFVKAGKGYAEYRLKKRLINFLYECRNLKREEIEDYMEKYASDPQRIGNLLLDSLYDLDNDAKARLAGRAYCYCVKNVGYLERDMFFRLVKIIQNCYFFDLLKLLKIEESFVNDAYDIPEISRETGEALFYNGLLNNEGISGGTFNYEPGGSIYGLSRYGKIIKRLLKNEE